MGQNTQEEWTKQLLLGMITEITELLEQTRWKVHLHHVPKMDKRNILFEIVDLFKYVLSLSELWGFNSHDLLVATSQKTIELHLKSHMDNFAPYKPVLITDMDGTLANWRATFVRLAKEYPDFVSEDWKDPEMSLNIERDMGIPYDRYIELKWLLESEGLYANLIPYPHRIQLVKEMSKTHHVVCWTARPAKKFKRIWMDSWNWLTLYGIHPDKLQIGSEERIEFAIRVKNLGIPVVMLEDNPELASRAVNSGIEVILCSTVYNQHLQEGPLLRRIV